MSDETPTTPSSDQPISIRDEMRTSYLDYAMSVIIGRAIPDARDGLKPVHRRILYAMRGLNLTPGTSFRKCAAVVGEVLGKYHPHGDASVYDALVRMAQDFSMRYPLVEGQGNFGSVDGDPAAAYRYTESRLARVAMELLQDIEKETVDFTATFDDQNTEPTVLPARYPNLLVNGSGGIAVGMATNIPPHNLSEIIDATVALIGNPDLTIEQLFEIVPGPDFPTAAFICGRSGAYQAYKTGRGSVVMRARSEIEKVQGTDREQIVITEIPYQVNKARLHAKIGSLMREKRIEGIREARDESDREGMRFVIELKKDVFPDVVLNQLYKLTDLQTSFGIINLAIVNNQPEVLDLKSCLELFIEHRREVVTRRTRFDLAKAQAQRELVEGLGMVTTDTDRVIATIRSSADPEIARQRLMLLPLKGLEEFVRRAGRPDSEIDAAIARGDYFLSERQAKAILDMRLARLTGLEAEKLAKEYSELSDLIAHLSAILADESLLLKLIVDELAEVKDKHGQPRRTEIIDDEAEIQIEDLIQEEEMVVTISNTGYIKRTPLSVYRAQKRGGKGNRGMEAATDDFVSQLFISSTHSYVLFFSERGQVYVKKVYEIPQAARNAKGRAIVNFIGVEPGERLKAICIAENFDDGHYVTTLTRKGQIKKTALSAYQNYREKGIIGVKIVEDDELLAAVVTEGNAEFLIATKSGKSIRFDEGQVRTMGRGAGGVKAIDLADDDVVVGFATTGDPSRDSVLAVCEHGYGKRTQLEEFRSQHRGGKGIILIDASERNGPVVGIALVAPKDEVLLMTDRGQTIRTRCEEIRLTGRNAQGVRVMNVGEEERIVALEVVAESDDDDDDFDAESTGSASGEGAEGGAGAEGSQGAADGADAEGTDGAQPEGGDHGQGEPSDG